MANIVEDNSGDLDAQANILDITDETEKPEETPEETKDESEVAEPPEEDEEESEEADTPEEEKEEEVSEDPEDKELKAKVEDEITRPGYKEIQKKYPNFFKDFPDIKEMYFRDAAYGSIFTSIEDAKQTARVAEVFQDINYKLSNGDITGVVEKIQSDTLPIFAENILFAIKDVNPTQYFRAIAPAVAELLHAAFNDGEKKGNRQLQLSVKNLCNFLYDKPELPKLKNRQVPPEVDARIKELDEREKGIFIRESNKFADTIESNIESKIRSWISNGIDPNNEMSEFTKDAVITATINDIQELAHKDQNFMQTMRLMYNKAAKVGWTDNMKSQIISSYLGRVKDQVGAIRNRRRAEALGRKLKNSDSTKANKFTSATSKSNGQVKHQANEKRNSQSIEGRRLSASQIDMRKTSELDVLGGKAVLK